MEKEERWLKLKRPFANGFNRTKLAAAGLLDMTRSKQARGCDA